MPEDYFGTLDKLSAPYGDYWLYRLDRLQVAGMTSLDHLPFSIRVLLESLIRQ